VCLFWKYYPVLPVLLGQTASTASRTCFGKRSYPVFVIYIPARAHMLGARVTFTVFVGPYHNIIMCHNNANQVKPLPCVLATGYTKFSQTSFNGAPVTAAIL